MEYFGEAIVQFCWLDLKMKNKKGVGYVDFLKNKKVRKNFMRKYFQIASWFFPTSYIFYICIKFQFHEFYERIIF